MSDLNEWRLSYSDTTFNFGTLASDYPLATQVDMSDVDITDQDERHSFSDGVVMGKDSFGGFTLTFGLKTIPDFPLPEKPWVDSLDLGSAFRAAWRADDIRRIPGQYATLLNVDRNRLVYGRPRKFAPKYDRLRKGLTEWLATFVTNGPDWYSGTEKAALITPVPPVGGGFTTPLTPPFSTAVGGSELAAMVNEGDLATWPVIRFHGPGKDYTLTLLDGVTPLWSITVSGQINFDQYVTVDTRPWSRGATITTGSKVAPANGRIRGDLLEDCKLPVGEFDAQFKVTDASGTAFADIKWRDAYASL